MTGLAFSKACELEDFSHRDVLLPLRQVYADRARSSSHFPRGREDRDDWEAAMAVRALSRFGALREDADLLAVPEEVGDVAAHIATRVRSLRFSAIGRDGPGPLPFPDGTFDGVFCSRSVHLDGLRGAAVLAKELGRVLKPGGVLSMVANFRLAGPPGGTGWPGKNVIFSAPELEQFVIASSGLVPVDALRAEVSPSTLATPRDLGYSTADRAAPRDDIGLSGYPRLVMVRDGYVFTSVHLTLRKA